MEDLPPGRSFVGIDALASYDVSIAIGEQSISRSELEQIAALKTPLVHIAGRWREVSPQQARAALAFFDKQGNEISFGGMLKWSAAGEWDSEDEREENVIMSQVVPPERMAEIIHCLTTGTVPPVEAPPGFMGTLRHYQLHGLAWIEFLTRFGLGGLSG